MSDGDEVDDVFANPFLCPIVTVTINTVWHLCRCTGISDQTYGLNVIRPQCTGHLFTAMVACYCKTVMTSRLTCDRKVVGLTPVESLSCV